MKPSEESIGEKPYSGEEKLHRVFLSLGSNLGQKENNLKRAIGLIRLKIGEIIKSSSFLQTCPWGFRSNHLFLNAVVEAGSILSPLEILDFALQIEKSMGRKEKTKEGQYKDRIIDIDIILYDDLILHSKRLDLPHLRFRERDFVLKPFCEIAPSAKDPVSGKSIRELLSELLSKN